MSLVLFLAVVLAWSAIVSAAIALHRLTPAGHLKAAGWPAYWLGAIAMVLLPAGMAVLFALVPALKPAFLDFGWPLAAGEPAAAPEMMPVGRHGGGEAAVSGVSAGSRPLAALKAAFFPMLMIAYGAGAVIAAGRLALGYGRAARIVHRAQPAGWQTARYPLLATGETDTAFAWALPGGASRAIILPDALTHRLPAEKLEGIVAHEEAHLDRRDPETGFVLSLLAVVFWFNPFVHGFIAQWRLAAELACDAAALKNASPVMRKAYAQTLIDALRIPAGRALPCPTAAFSTTKLKDEKMRLNNILKGNAMSVVGIREKLVLGASAAALVLAGCAGAAAMTQEAPQASLALTAPAAPQAPLEPQQIAWQPGEAPVLDQVWVSADGDVQSDRYDDRVAMVNMQEEDGEFQQVITFKDGRRITKTWDDLTPEEQQQIRDDIAQAEKDLAEARIDIEEARRDIDEARADVARDLEEMRRELDDEEAGLSEEQRRQIESELERAQEEIERAKVEMEKAMVEIEEERVRMRERAQELARERAQERTDEQADD